MHFHPHVRNANSCWCCCSWLSLLSWKLSNTNIPYAFYQVSVFWQFGIALPPNEQRHPRTKVNIYRAAFSSKKILAGQYFQLYCLVQSTESVYVSCRGTYLSTTLDFGSTVWSYAVTAPPREFYRPKGESRDFTACVGRFVCFELPPSAWALRGNSRRAFMN